MKVKVELEVCDAEDAATALMYDNPRVSKLLAHAVAEARLQQVPSPAIDKTLWSEYPHLKPWREQPEPETPARSICIVDGQETLPIFLRRQAD